jgi:hypothetical protein
VIHGSPPKDGRPGGNAKSPTSFGIGADTGRHEHRQPSTGVPTEAESALQTYARTISRGETGKVFTAA